MDMKKYRLGEVCTIIPGYAAFERVTTLKFMLTFSKFENLQNLSYCITLHRIIKQNNKTE